MNKQQLLKSLKARGFSKQTLNSFAKIKRENFVPSDLETRAYEDRPLPIGQGQTISQPYTIAMMLDMLKLEKGQRVLEVGSGCGYVLALLSEIVGKKGEVYGIEIIKELAERSKENLKGYTNVKVYYRTGVMGLQEHAPFDRIIISAACKDIPDKLREQLKNNGIIVAPIGEQGYTKSLIAFKKEDKNKLTIKKQLHGFAFVPFVED